MGPFSIEPSVTITYEFQLWRNSNEDAGRKSNSFSETYQNTIKWLKMGPFVHYIEEKKFLVSLNVHVELLLGIKSL